MTTWFRFNDDAIDTQTGSNAALSGGPLFIGGQVEQALRFDGVDDSARVSASPAVDVGAGAGLTVEAWIRPENVQSPGALLEWSDSVSKLGVHFYVASSSPGSLFANVVDINGSSHSFSTPSGLLSTGQWQHVGLTYSRTSGVARLFLNGTSVVQQAMGTFQPETRTDLQVGRRVLGGNAYRYRGGLDELSLYNRALTGDEINAIYLAGSAGKCAPVTNPPPVAPQFQLGHDFSLASNPNGVWSYGSMMSLGGQFTPLSFARSGTAESWEFQAGAWPAIYHNNSTNTLVLSGGQAVFPPDSVWLAAGENGNQRNFGVIRFTVPATAAGSFRIEARSRSGFVGAVSSDADFHVAQNGIELFGVNRPASSTNWIGYTNVLILGAGDTIDLAVGRGNDGSQPGSLLMVEGWITSLSTNLPPPPPPPATHDLGRDFSLAANPNGVWSYGSITNLGGQFTPLSFMRAGTPESWEYQAGTWPAIYHNNSMSAIVTDGGQGVYPAGSVWLAAGENGTPRAFGVIRFTVPAGGDGSYLIETRNRSGLVGPISSDADFHVAQNGVELFGVNRLASSTDWVGYSNTMALAAGDVIDLLTGRGADGSQPGSVLRIEGFITRLSTNAPPPPQTNCVPAPTDLAAWFPFEGNAVDRVSSNNAVLSGGPVFVAGQVGQGLRLAGVDDAGRAAASPALDIGVGNGLTIEMWVRPEHAQSPGALVEWSDNNGNLGAHFYIASSSPGSLFANLIDRNGGSHSFSSPAGLVATGQWQHVAVTYSRSNGLARLYLNGASIAQQNLGSFQPDTRGDLQIGQRVIGGPPYRYHGGLDELSLYGRALSQSELLAIFAAGAAGKCPTNLPPPPPLQVAPVIVSQPQGTTVYAGETVSFNVQAEGTAPLSFQWRRNNSPLPGQDGPTLILSNVQPAQAGNYSVLVSNLVRAVVSSNALLVVNIPPLSNCVTPPSGLTAWWPFNQNALDVINGTNAMLIGMPAFIPGKVGQALRLDGVDDAARTPARSALDIGSGGGMSVELWIRPDDVQSPGALVEWSDAIGRLGAHFYIASASPGSLFANLIDTNGNSHSFSSPSGLVTTSQWQHVALTYQQSNGLARLYLNGVPVAQQFLGPFRAETRLDLQVGQRVLDGNPYRYRGGLDELSLYSRALSEAEVVSIFAAGSFGKCFTNPPPPLNVPPTIVLQPRDTNAFFGQTVLLRVAATGTAPLRYQWYFNDLPLPGRISPLLILSNAQPIHAGYYHAVVTNAAGMAISSNALLVINVPSNRPPEGFPQTRTLLEDSSVPVVLSGFDPDGNPLTYSITTPPAHGTLSGTLPDVTYIPAHNFNGTDSFQFRVSDGQLSSAPATVTLQVTPLDDPPILIATVGPLFPIGNGDTNWYILATNGTDAAVVFDASFSSDLDGTPLSFLWYLEGETEPFGLGSTVTNTLPVGPQLALLIASDEGRPYDSPLSFEVVTPGDLVEELIARIEASSLSRKDKRPLLEALKKSSRDFERGKLKQALEKLELFQRKLRTHVSKDYPQLAGEWTAFADQILSAFGR